MHLTDTTSFLLFTLFFLRIYEEDYKTPDKWDQHQIPLHNFIDNQPSF